MATPAKSTSVETAPRMKSRYPIEIWRSMLIRPPVYTGIGAGVAALLVLPSYLSGALSEAIAWCLGGSTYLLLNARIMAACHLDKIKSRAAKQDEGAIVILVLIMLAIFSSLTVIFGLLSQAKAASDGGKFLYIGLAALAILIAWLVMQVVFMMHYAHEYYAPENIEADAPRVLEFPKDTTPDYWDFFYFATSIGATSQTSDVAITSKSLRRLVTVHGTLAFFFNTMVLALAINLAASLA